MIAAAALPRVAKDITLELKRGRVATALGIARLAARAPDWGAEKIISREYRYVWFCIPKVASRSIMAALRSVTPDAEVFSGLSATRLFALRPEARHYYRFAFIRHPFTRALSLHAELHRFHRHHHGDQRRIKRDKRRRLFERSHGLSDTVAFNDYCRWLATPYAADEVADRHVLSQHLQLVGDDGRPPDFIGRFESLANDFSQVLHQLGLPQAALPLKNTMAGWEASPAAVDAARSTSRAHLTPANKALLAARYAQDLQFGDYPAV